EAWQWYERPGAAPPPAGVEFPFGLVEFTVRDVAPGGVTVGSLSLPPVSAAERITSYWKFGPTTDNPAPHWYEFLFDPATGTGARIEGDTIFLDLRDGGLRSGDDGPDDGRILGVGGPGFRAAPVVNDDTATVRQDSGANRIDVLANDSTDGGGLAVKAVTQGAHGRVAITADGSAVTYTPDAGFHGADAFTYTVRDERGGTASAGVSVTVTAAVQVRGQKFDDRNGNGTRDAGEPGLKSWTVELVDAATGAVVATQVTRDVDLNGDGIIDP